MINWNDKRFPCGKGSIEISGSTLKDTFNIIHEYAKRQEKIPYSELINRLKQKGNKKISRRTIGFIVGEVSIQVSSDTKSSIYPSAIVIRKDSSIPGEGFWGVDSGTTPPSDCPKEHRKIELQKYQKNVFDWGSNIRKFVKD